MKLVRKIAMVSATLSVAFGAGHLMQGGGLPGLSKPPRVSASENPPKSIVPLAAGLGNTEVATLPIIPAEPPLPLPDIALEPTPVVEPAPPPSQPLEALSGDTTNCPVELDVFAAEDGMIEVSLMAPCRANERVVMRHGGLAVTMRTSLIGSSFVLLPGMDISGEVSLRFSDGVEVSAAAALPDLDNYRRFAVQWTNADSFELNAFEGGATYGQAGHVSAADPSRRIPGVPSRGGFLTILGDDSVDLPMLAEVYTYSNDPDLSVDLTVEANVTEATCGRDLLGELLLSERGAVIKTDLTVAAPACDAIGDVLVLNNPLADLKLAEAN
jgi:hypothetical protein